MSEWRNAPVLKLLLILAFITAGISPACKFISGQAGFIEICTSDGLKTIAVPEEQAPAQHDEKKSKQCAFCFTSSNFKATQTAPIKLFSFSGAGQEIQLSDAGLTCRRVLSCYAARAPPVLL